MKGVRKNTWRDWFKVFGLLNRAKVGGDYCDFVFQYSKSDKYKL